VLTNIFSSIVNTVARLGTYNASRKPEFYLDPGRFRISPMHAIDTNFPIANFPTSVDAIKNLKGTYV